MSNVRIAERSAKSFTSLLVCLSFVAHATEIFVVRSTTTVVNKSTNRRKDENAK